MAHPLPSRGLLARSVVAPAARSAARTAAFERELASYQKNVAELQRSVQRLQVQQRRLGALARQLQTVGDDAQMMQIDLQNTLQKQQQMVQILSNITKRVHDIQSSIIRDMK